MHVHIAIYNLLKIALLQPKLFLQLRTGHDAVFKVLGRFAVSSPAFEVVCLATEELLMIPPNALPQIQ